MGSSENYRHEIPIRSFVNAKVIDYAVEDDSFLRCQRRALDDFGCDQSMEYQFKNPAYIAGMLYCLVVVPKELWLQPQNHQVYNILQQNSVVELFEIINKDKRFDQDPTYYLIHHLRNSVAHASFRVNQSQDFVFTDSRNKNGPVDWEARITNKNLFVFLSKIGQQSDELRKAYINQ